MIKKWQFVHTLLSPKDVIRRIELIFTWFRRHTDAVRTPSRRLFPTLHRRDGEDCLALRSKVSLTSYPYQFMQHTLCYVNVMPHVSLTSSVKSLTMAVPIKKISRGKLRWNFRGKYSLLLKCSMLKVDLTLILLFVIFLYHIDAKMFFYLTTGSATRRWSSSWSLMLQFASWTWSTTRKARRPFTRPQDTREGQCQNSDLCIGKFDIIWIHSNKYLPI